MWNIVSFVAVLILVESCLGSSQSIEFKLHLPKGYKAVTVVTKQSNGQMVITPPPAHVADANDSKKIVNESTETNEYLLECLDVDPNGVMTIKETLTSRKEMRKYGDLLLLKYDSKDKEAEVSRNIAPLAVQVNESLTFRITPKGDVFEVTGAKALAEKIGKKLRFSGAQREQQQTILFERFKYSRPQAIPRYYPASAVFIGQSWITPSFCSGKTCPTLDVASNTWTLQSIKEGIAHFKIVTKMNNDSIGSVPGNMKVISKSLKGTGVSDMYIDVKTGLITSWEQKTTVENNLIAEVSGPNGAITKTTVQSDVGTMKLKTVLSGTKNKK